MKFIYTWLSITIFLFLFFLWNFIWSCVLGILVNILCYWNLFIHFSVPIVPRNIYMHIHWMSFFKCFQNINKKIWINLACGVKFCFKYISLYFFKIEIHLYVVNYNNIYFLIFLWNFRWSCVLSILVTILFYWNLFMYSSAPIVPRNIHVHIH